jgi:integrase
LIIIEILSRLDMSSVNISFNQFRYISRKIGIEQLINLLVGLAPHAVREQWLEVIIPNFTNIEVRSLKSALHSLCIQAIGPWTPEYRDYVAKLPTPRTDYYRTVRTGDCFVPLDQQSLIIDYFDEMTAQVGIQPAEIDPRGLRDACILIISHQHALRPGQVARLRVADVRIHDTGAVHFSYPLLKQRRSNNMRRVTRRVKREWGRLFAAYSLSGRAALMDAEDFTPTDSFFGLKPAQISDVIQDLTESITGERWTATDLRHTAAQRLTDGGVSHIAISEFMGHASVKTANVYFDTSPTQAQRVNQALALSPIYSTVVEVAKTRTINKATLMRLPPDKQIGAVPHGIPIAGIGGCRMGQSLCSKNPVLSCYTCRKFMPVKDSRIHEEVVQNLRTVVKDFADASRGNEESPAYTQLRRMLTAATQVVAEIEAGVDETVGDEDE